LEEAKDRSVGKNEWWTEELNGISAVVEGAQVMHIQASLFGCLKMVICILETGRIMVEMASGSNMDLESPTTTAPRN